MQNVSVVSTSLMMTLFRAIDRHHLGAKIPDLIVDRLIAELCGVSQTTLDTLLLASSCRASSVGQQAYCLWKAGKLNALSLAREVERTSRFNPPSTSEHNHTPAAALHVTGVFRIAHVAQ